MLSDQIFDLPVVERKSEHISLRELGGLSVVVVDHPGVRAAVALQGAHLISWQPAGHEPVLWLSDAAVFEEGTAIRGGVPVCWPWFGPAGQPSHGFARISDFEIADLAEDAHGVRLRFVLRDDERTIALWPNPFELFVGFQLGETCEITLEAHGDFATTAALHSYLNVGDVDGVEVTGLGEPYLDQVAGEPGTQNGALSFPERTDRVYTTPEDVSRVEQPALKRAVEIHHHGHSDVVAWNPGPELSHSMADLTDEGYREFVCVETARISAPLISGAGAPAVLAATFSIAS
jgi:glucose-6-phosphate 1-epimerase